MIETDYVKRQEAYRVMEAFRDSIVKSVFAEYKGHTLRSDRTVTDGANAQYVIEYKGQPHCIIDTATISSDGLARDIRHQLNEKLGSTSTAY
jgi:RNase adaptor protein for sRNA GlmZ degradation